MGAKASSWTNFRESQVKAIFEKLTVEEKKEWEERRDNDPDANQKRRNKNTRQTTEEPEWSDAEEVGAEEIDRRNKMIVRQR